jgi:toxin YoeB
MKTILTEEFIAEYASFRRSNPARIVRIEKLMQAIVAEPTSGIGRPERLRHQLSGLWSRRIDLEHRLVYKIEGDMVIFMR